MKTHVSYIAAAALAASYLLVPGSQQTAHAAGALEDKASTPTPIVFQAAGPTAASIQSMVDAFRAAIGGANNGNVPGSLPDGRREINWDGGGSTATSIVPSPFDGFLVTRGARFTTRGFGFAQAPADGLAATFNNATYATIFQAFSPTRLFTSLESNLTTARFFVPGGGECRPRSRLSVRSSPTSISRTASRTRPRRCCSTACMETDLPGRRAGVERRRQLVVRRRAVRRGDDCAGSTQDRQRGAGAERQQPARGRHDGRLHLRRAAGDRLARRSVGAARSRLTVRDLSHWGDTSWSPRCSTPRLPNPRLRSHAPGLSASTTRPRA